MSKAPKTAAGLSTRKPASDGPILPAQRLFRVGCAIQPRRSQSLGGSAPGLGSPRPGIKASRSASENGGGEKNREEG